jgi:hypothetical protein
VVVVADLSGDHWPRLLASRLEAWLLDTAQVGRIMTAPRDELELARLYLANAQSLNELEGMGGHAFFTLGCAVNKLIEHAEKVRATTPQQKDD